MLSLTSAIALRDAGLRWTPSKGDEFVLPGKEMDDDVFVLADMTVEVHDFEAGRIIGFNGTTEWALDSVEQSEAVWLPNETQLREALAGTFRRLERDDDGYRVVISVVGSEAVAAHPDVSEAYARALLHLITGEEIAV